MSRRRKSAAADAEVVRATREVAGRALRRLDMMEWVLFLVAAALSTGAGALVALLLAPLLHVSYRVLWVASSVVIFGVPGWLVVRRVRREEKEWRDKVLNQIGGSDG